ncbi:MAG TPA: hypothetical protein VFM02_03615 [Candidatus Paceibacterota bacterium]|nr:hypothetical protein [Candidatus Paceibacterota bacterium]
MCVPCRVTKLSKKSAEIRGTKQNRTKDEIEKKKVVDEKEKKRIWAIAEESQRATKTKKYADS